MFTQLKNIDTAFRHIKLFSIIMILVCMVISLTSIYQSYRFSLTAQNRIHILYNGKVLEAVAADRKANLPVEIRDHIKTFHQDFFNLSPDDKAITTTISKALNLADQSAKKQYDNLRESGFYNNLIAANISQEILIDSIRLNIDTVPFQFRCYATQTMVRASSTTKRRLVTRGEVRMLSTQTDNNPHGMLIQNWETLENTDIIAR